LFLISVQNFARGLDCHKRASFTISVRQIEDTSAFHDYTDFNKKCITITYIYQTSVEILVLCNSLTCSQAKLKLR